MEGLSQLVTSRFSFGPGHDTKSDLASLPVPLEFYYELVDVFNNPSLFEAAHFQKYPIDVILQYLKCTHQFYLERRLGEIELSIENLVRNNEQGEHWFEFLHRFFETYKTELTEHILDEEENLFPYIDALLLAEQKKEVHFQFSQKIKLINFLLRHDHQIEDDLRKVVRILGEKSGQFEDSFSFRMLMIQLKNFELDLAIHARMEEEVLMPKALELEKEILNNAKIPLKGGDV
ncbi:MAG: hemerythrin domain-containing protein [Cytophagales bacterium]|nr:hemerythrin domain-containing protein [Cytophagales bacterium]